MPKKDLNSIAFPKLEDSQMEALEQFATLKSFADQQALFTAGDRKFKFFVIKKGNVEIVEHFTGKEKKVTLHEEKEFTGDIDMLAGKPTIVTAIAKGNCQVYEISTECLRKIVKEIPQLGNCILKAFLSRKKLLEELECTRIHVVGSKFSRDTFRIRNFLSKNKIPFMWRDVEKDLKVNKLLELFEIDKAETPIVTFDNYSILKNPSNIELGKKLGITKFPEDKVYDLAIVGAGPAGLAAAVYGASEGLETVVFDQIAPGGQAGCSSNIENYMGFPMGLSGTALASRAVIQAQKFGAHISVPERVVGLEFDSSYQVLRFANGKSISSKCVLIATGVSYRKLNIEGYKRFEGCGIYYSATAVEAQICRSATVVIVGGGNSAGQAAIFLSEHAKKVLLLIRGNSLYKTMSQYLVKRVEQTENIELSIDTEIERINGDDILHSVDIRNNKTGQIKTVETAAVFIFIGAIPNTNWLPVHIEVDNDGFVKTGLEVENFNFGKAGRQPFLLETTRPGVFAAGDVRSDSIKRVTSAVGEGSMTVKFVHQILS